MWSSTIFLRGDQKRKNNQFFFYDRMIWYLVILVAAVVWHLISLKYLFWQTFLALFLLVQCVGVKACTEFVVSEGACIHLGNCHWLILKAQHIHNILKI